MKDRKGELERDLETSARRSIVILFALQVILFTVMNLHYLFQWSDNQLSFFRWVTTVYTFNTIYLPIFMLVSCAVILYSATRLSEKRWIVRAVYLLIVYAACMVGLRVYSTYIEPHGLVVRHVTIETPKLDRPLKLLHISDFQSSLIGRYEARAIRTMNSLEPDLIVHTGDLLQPLPPATWDTELPKLRELLQTLKPPLGIYSIIGDADDPILYREIHEAGGMKFLHSEEITIPYGESTLRMYGLSLDQSRNGDASAIKEWFENTNPGDLTLLLGHAPDFILNMQDRPIDLCLAGHTHGGQVRIPFYGPLTIASDVPREWARGFRMVGKTRINVSAGIGCEHCEGVTPVRFNCPPEMTLVQFQPEQ